MKNALFAITLAWVVSATSNAAGAELTVVENENVAAALSALHCKIIAGQEIFTLPPGLIRKNACFFGVLYADREYRVVFPMDSANRTTP